MKNIPIIALITLVSFVVGISCNKDDSATDQTYDLIRIQTNHGNMVMWLYDETPLHKANYLKLANEGFYNGLIFHRVINDFVIQGGDPLGTGTGGPGYTIDAEFVTSLTHVYGAVGAARDNNPAKASNGSQYYIVENPAGTHSLDGDYTVFGIIIDGLSTVSAIAEVPTNSSDKPLTDVVMTKVEVVKYTEAELDSNFGFNIP
jgi:cyclophilin family peptidyl-prolyl cis-trans isomerase